MIKVKWKDDEDKVKQGRIVGAFREDGETYIIIFGLDSLIHNVLATKIKP